jgi:hypothetical protein
MPIKKFKDFKQKSLRKSQDDFNKHMFVIYPNDDRVEEREGMQKAYDFLLNFEKFGNITSESLIKYMWETYPNDEELPKKNVKTYDFLSGNYDNEKLEREKIRAEEIDKVSAKFNKKD